MDASAAFGVADEGEVGIFSFTCCDFVPIAGVIKQVPEDFRVWELRLDGSVVKPPLGEPLGRPRARAAEVGDEEENDEDAEAEQDEIVVEPPRKGGRRWAGDGGDHVDPDDCAGVAEELERDDAAVGDDHEAVACCSANGSDLLSKAGRSDDDADASEALFLKFVLWKRCTDTLEALGALAVAMGLRVGLLGFAGIKDSVAVTCQEVSVARMLPNSYRGMRVGPECTHGRPLEGAGAFVTCAMVRAAAQEVGEHIQVGCFSGAEAGLWPGQLTGNRFRIVLRRCILQLSPNAAAELHPDETTNNTTTPCGCRRAGASRNCPQCSGRAEAKRKRARGASDSSLCEASAKLAVRSALRAIRRRGFVNYIGMQRFGKGGVRSDLVGLAYLQRDYERCVDLILFGPPEGGPHGSSPTGRRSQWRPPVPKWAELFRRTWSADSALRVMPDHGRGTYWVERRLLTALRRLQQAAQCSSWEMSEEHSWCEQCRFAFLAIPWSMRKLYTFAYLDRLWNICASERVALGVESPIAGDLVWDDPVARTVKLLRPEDVASASIFDVVIPRPGRSVALPDNIVGALMKQYLRYDLDCGLEDLCAEVWARPEEGQAAEEGCVDEDLGERGTWESAEGDEEEEEEGQESAMAWEGEDAPEGADEPGGGNEVLRGSRATTSAPASADWAILGDYRSLLCRPSNLRWSVGEQPDEATPRHHPGQARPPPVSLHRVTLTFDLQRGTYATMFLRELCFRRDLRPLSTATPVDGCGRGGGDGRGGGGGCEGSARHLVWSSDEEDTAKDAGGGSKDGRDEGQTLGHPPHAPREIEPGLAASPALPLLEALSAPLGQYAASRRARSRCSLMARSPSWPRSCCSDASGPIDDVPMDAHLHTWGAADLRQTVMAWPRPRLRAPTKMLR